MGQTQTGLKKPPDQVRRRNTKLVTQLPPEGRQGKAPKWPLARASKRESEIWAELWAMPQAVVWEQWQLEMVVAQYAQLVAQCEKPDPSATLLGERRQMQIQLGLTPAALFKLQWTLAPQADPVQGVTDLEAYKQAVGS